MTFFRIVDWVENYENNRTKDMKVMQWVPVPIKHDGYGYGLLVQKNGAARLGAWLAILQTAAKSHPRGTLLRDGRHPHTAASIAMKTRLSEEAIAETIAECLKTEIGWIEVVELQGDKIVPAEIPQLTAETPQEPARNGMEGKGKRREEKKPPNPQRGNGRRLTEGQKQLITIKENTPVMDRIGGWFGRPPGKPWSLYEAERLDLVNPTDAELEGMERFYTAEKLPDKVYRRQSVSVLLNNWRSEIDKARNFKPAATENHI